MANGFRLLKPNGILVYSTCSFSRKQNEDIVAHFLLLHPDAQCEPIPRRSEISTAPELDGFDRFAGLKHTVRLSPIYSRTSGLFIARIRKKKH